MNTKYFRSVVKSVETLKEFSCLKLTSVIICLHLMASLLVVSVRNGAEYIFHRYILSVLNIYICERSAKCPVTGALVRSSRFNALISVFSWTTTLVHSYYWNISTAYQNHYLKLLYIHEHSALVGFYAMKAAIIIPVVILNTSFKNCQFKSHCTRNIFFWVDVFIYPLRTKNILCLSVCGNL